MKQRGDEVFELENVKHKNISKYFIAVVFVFFKLYPELKTKT